MIRSRYMALVAVLTAACTTPTPSPTISGAATPLVSALATPLPSTASSAPIVSAAAAQACTTSDLSISVTNTGVAAGNVGGYLRFLNTAAVPCYLQGPPTLTAVTADGAMVSAKVSTVVGTPFPALRRAPEVVLTPGESAFAAYGGTDNPGSAEATCPPAYHTFRVAPPGDSTTVDLPAYNTGLAQDQPSCFGIEVTVIAPEALVQQYNDLSSLHP